MRSDATAPSHVDIYLERSPELGTKTSRRRYRGSIRQRAIVIAETLSTSLQCAPVARPTLPAGRRRRDGQGAAGCDEGEVSRNHLHPHRYVPCRFPLTPLTPHTVIKRDGKYAFIEFDTPQHARKAYKAYEKDPIISARQNRTLQLVYSNASTYMRPPVTPTDTLFIGSIPYSTNPALLTAHFEKFGTLSRTYAKPAKDTSAPGYMNIQFADQAAAVSAFEECRDNPLRVRVSTDNVELGPDSTDDGKYTVHTLFVDYQQPQRAPEGPPSRNLHFTGWTRGPRELKTWLYKELRSGVDEVMNIKFGTSPSSLLLPS